MSAEERVAVAWTDRLLAAIAAWPAPLPVSLALLWLALSAFLHVVEWVTGELAPREFDAFILSLPVYPVTLLGVTAVQNRVSLNALQRFRPATDLDDRAFARLAFDLTHQPAGSALVSGMIFGVLGLITEAAKEGAADRLDRFPLAYVVYLGVSFAFYAFVGPWLIRTYRLLHRVHILHRDACRVDLLHPDPVHAFSSVTATVGASFIAISTFSMVTDPASLDTMTGLLTVGLLAAVGGICFVLPLWGMHRRLQAEQTRLGREVAQRIDATIAQIYRHVDEDRDGATELRDRLTALLSVRDLTNRLSTWPWQPETPRWLVSALFAPLILWGVTRLLDRLLG